MKFINYFESITGVDIYAIIAFMIFFTLFIGVSIWAWKADKKLIKKLGNIPLEN